jgi:hypothetical protein
MTAAGVVRRRSATTGVWRDVVMVNGADADLSYQPVRVAVTTTVSESQPQRRAWRQSTAAV